MQVSRRSALGADASFLATGIMICKRGKILNYLQRKGMSRDEFSGFSWFVVKRILQTLGRADISPSPQSSKFRSGVELFGRVGGMPMRRLAC